MSKCLNCGKPIKQIGPRPRKYCNSTCRSNHWQKEKRKELAAANPVERADFHILTTKEGIKKIDEALKNEGYVRPKTLEQLKKMCPANLKGLDKSHWIAKNRTKYNI